MAENQADEIPWEFPLPSLYLMAPLERKYSARFLVIGAAAIGAAAVLAGATGVAAAL
ncbi:hypothetical protein [Streptomyces platensis]|uniref:hypothetical protein n=1 Tax=Streptomyces platensis TaxID=58346 RepID=UPI001302E7D3|nr:hypothetical protein [Streptomyces platensis]